MFRCLVNSFHYFGGRTEEILFDSRAEFETKLNRYDVKLKRVQTTDDSELDGKVKVKLVLEIKSDGEYFEKALDRYAYKKGYTKISDIKMIAF